MRISQVARQFAVASAAAIFGLVVAVSTVQAQCSTGNCGNVGVADAHGGYGTVAYGHSGLMTNSPTSGDQWGHRNVQPLFDNYFTQGNANQANAALYISPVGVPGSVGHTYNTYQPFYPHHFLYQHKDRYHSYYDQGFGFNRTKAHYIAPPVKSTYQYVHRKLEIPR